MPGGCARHKPAHVSSWGCGEDGLVHEWTPPRTAYPESGSLRTIESFDFRLKKENCGWLHKRRPTELPPPVVMLQMIQGFWISRAIYVAAKLGIPDLLKGGPQSSKDLAQATGTHAPTAVSGASRARQCRCLCGKSRRKSRRRFRADTAGRDLAHGCPGFRALLCSDGTRGEPLSRMGEGVVSAFPNRCHSIRPRLRRKQMALHGGSIPKKR